VWDFLTWNSLSAAMTDWLTFMAVPIGFILAVLLVFWLLEWATGALWGYLAARRAGKDKIPD
jgi:divalent metal cation (Fe/Co/Zn/Cd) transporter